MIKSVRAIISIVLCILWMPGTALAYHCKPLLKPSAQPHIGGNMNTLLEPSSLFFGALPFGQVAPGDFRSAFLEGLRRAQERVDALRARLDAPTFENTMDALEAIDEPYLQVSSLFSHFLSVRTNKDLEKLAEEINPLLSQFSNAIVFDPIIFARVEKLYVERATLKLSTEQLSLLEKTYRSFVRNGAKLSSEGKKRVDEIDARMSVLAEKYKGNQNQAINAFHIEVTDQRDLAGLPEGAVHAAQERAEKKGKPNSWVVTLQAPSYVPFIQYADNRALREKLWRAMNAQATSGESDNRPVLLEIAKLREERAHLLGYKTHAHYTTEERMAQNPEIVQAFLTRLGNAYRPAAQRDLEELRAFAGLPEIRPWDVAYYSEKLRQKVYKFDGEELRPYFKLENVIQGAFAVAGRLYGLTFKPRNDIPTWDPHVQAFEVLNRKHETIALFYLDPFPREDKQSGAWMNAIRDSGIFAGTYRHPHVINVGNFTPPAAGKPALLTADEVETVFHELGHGLHGMLSQVKYRSISGTNVPWDFVELPSMINENWAFEPEVLDLYAHHFQTGARIPAELVAKYDRARNFQAGWQGLRQVSLASLDFAWHAQSLDGITTPDQVENWENQAMAPFRLIPVPNGAIFSTTFGHIFCGGYSAGYYSYKWSEVLASDGFAVFKREGIFNPETASRFEREILSKGGSDKPATLYRHFRGGDPDPDALLRKEGLLGP